MNRQLLVITEIRPKRSIPWFKDANPTVSESRSFLVDTDNPPQFLDNVDKDGHPADHHNEQGEACSDHGYCICGTWSNQERKLAYHTLIKQTRQQPTKFLTHLTPEWLARNEYNRTHGIRLYMTVYDTDYYWNIIGDNPYKLDNRALANVARKTGILDRIKRYFG